MNQEKISKLIKELRTRNNLTQVQFADKYNVTYQAVSKWENGKNLPDISLLTQICRDFNIDINDFLEGNESNKKRKFFYDFNENGLPVEVKGILRPSDACKQDQCPQVRFVFGEEVKDIMKELNKKCPGWRNDYVEL